jgi:BirA family biotin operon repressor/biotin-[acetyl-CoA-carboxylase] ligase
MLKENIKAGNNCSFFHFEKLNSTNDKALELLKNPEYQNNFIVVTADEQTNGRGRNKKVWLGNKNENLYFSFAFRHKLSKIPIYSLQIIAGLAVHKTLREIFDKFSSNNSDFKIKYPNDIYAKSKNSKADNIEFKKISGLISETNLLDNENCHSVLGIGINNKQTIFPLEIRENVTSLANLGINISMNELSQILSENIVKYFLKPHQETISEWQKKLELSDKKFKIVTNSLNLSNKNCNFSENNYSDEIFSFKNFLEDGRIVLISASGIERIIDNGDSVRYNLT